MAKFLLDTNIISDAFKLKPSAGLAQWIRTQPIENLFISAWTIAEVRHGIVQLPAGAKREAVESWYRSATGPLSLFTDRILALDTGIAEIWADLMIEGRRLGRPRSFTDMIIAATAISHECQIVTNNERDFWGLDCINPMKTGSAAG